jgi:hypothetical protein
MANVKKRINFYESEIGLQIEQILVEMTRDEKYNTAASYSANTNAYPDNSISFVNKHMNYLNNHPNINPDHYISNLRLLTKLHKV